MKFGMFTLEEWQVGFFYGLFAGLLGVAFGLCLRVVFGGH